MGMNVQKLILPSPKYPVLSFKYPTPAQWSEYLLNYPEYSNLATIYMTETSLRQIREVNRNINSLRYASEPKDTWKILENDEQGDCDDLALTKRFQLAKIYHRGCFPPIICRTPVGAHLVCGVWSDLGLYIMDNLCIDIMPWTALNYTWIAMLESTHSWRMLSPTG